MAGGTKISQMTAASPDLEDIIPGVKGGANVKFSKTQVKDLIAPNAKNFATIAAANAAIPVARRYVGMIVPIGTPAVEHWYYAGTANANLIVKAGTGGADGSETKLVDQDGVPIPGSGTPASPYIINQNFEGGSGGLEVDPNF